MTCERYQEWIRESALGALNAAGQARLEAHLLTCAACTREFDAERELLGAIDQELRRYAGARPSSDFAAGVRLRLAAERGRANSGWARGGRIWAPIGALAAVAVLLLTVWFARRPPGTLPRQAKAPAPPASVQSAGREATGEASPTPKVGGRLTASARTSSRELHAARSKHATREDEAPQLQVLVQPGQWAGIISLYRTAQSGSVDLSSPAERSPESQDPLKVKPIEIDPLAIAALQPPKPIESAEREDRTQ